MQFYVLCDTKNLFLHKSVTHHSTNENKQQKTVLGLFELWENDLFIGHSGIVCENFDNIRQS